MNIAQLVKADGSIHPLMVIDWLPADPILDATERAREDTCIAAGPADWAERAGDGAEPEWTEDQEDAA